MSGVIPFSALDETAPADASPLDGAPTEEETDQADPSGFDGGWWLTEPDGTKVKAAALELWKRDRSAAEKRAAREKRNELIRAGVRGVRVVASTERDEYQVRAPFGAEDAPKAPNKADQLIRRIAATLTVDPPGPEVAPTSDNDDERSAAELAERVLKVEGAPSERDDVSLLRQLIDMAGTYGSVFVYSYVHPQGGGLVPLEIQAHAGAQTTEDALTVVDPMTGMPTPVDPSTLTTRYVRVDGSLTDSASEAQMVWRPRVIETLCRPSQVRYAPTVGVTGIENAPGIMVGMVETLADVIARHYGGERPDEDTVKQLVAWKPEDTDYRRWVPKSQRESLEGAPPMRGDLIADDALVVTLTLYLKSGPMAPHGVCLTIGGPKEPLAREPWRATIGEGPQARVEHLPLPVAQMRWREDTSTGDPYGVAGIDDLGAMEEIRASMLKYVLDYAHRFGSLQVFLPMGTTIQPGQLERRGEPVYVAPGQEPFYEPLPPMTPVVQGVYDGMGTEMDTASGLEQSAQGVASSSVKSGRHAQQVIEQALVALAGIQQNSNKAMTRVWSVRLVLMRAFYDTPRMLDYLGEGGDYQQRTWSGMDLMGAGDVQIAKGSGTMLPRSAKAELAREELMLAAQLGDQAAVQRYRRAVEGGTAPLLGLQDDPVRQRIARQLAGWRQGAKGQHEPAPEPVEQLVPDEMTGEPVPQLVPAPDPVADEAAQLFAPNPSDELPTVAPVRFAELTDAIASRAFLQADPRYQQALYAEYERMRQAAGVMTLAEQQQAQVEQQQMQQQMQLEMIESKNAEQAAKTAYAEESGGPASQRMAMQNAVEQTMRSATPQPDMT